MPLYSDGTAGNEYGMYDNNDAIAVTVADEISFVLTNDGRVLAVQKPYWSGGSEWEEWNLNEGASNNESEKTSIDVVSSNPEFFNYKVHDDYVTVMGYTENANVVEVPSSYEGKPITEIVGLDGGTVFTRNSGFNDSMTSIILPDTISTIGEYAFLGCKITDIDIPTSVNKIGKEAFGNCRDISEIIIPSNVENIDEEAFISCGASRIVLENGVKEIGEEAFSSCDNLKEITIPGSVKRLHEKTFYGCGSMENATIEEGVTVIYAECFGNCFSLNSITLPTSIGSIGDDVFKECNQLKDVFYAGSEEQWANIKKGANNNALDNATIHFGS